MNARAVAIVLLAVLAVTVLGAGYAEAKWYIPPRSQGHYPERAIERPLVLAKGWMELGLDVSYTLADSYFDRDGHFEEGDYALKDTTFKLRFRYGWTKNLTLGLELPYAIKTFENDFDLRIESQGLEDTRMWATYQVYSGDSGPMSSIVIRLATLMPTGNESPGTISNVHLDEIIFSRGVYAIALSAAAKRQVWRTALTGEIGANFWLPGTVQYVIGPGGSNGQMDYGDEFFAKASMLFELTKSLTLSVKGRWAVWGNAKQGVRGHLETLSGTNGWIASVEPVFVIQMSKHWELLFAIDVPVAGRNSTPFFPLTYMGPGYRAGITCRF